MKKYVILVICLFSVAAYASQKAVTDEGSIVILNSDGTWQYENDSSKLRSPIKTNKDEFKKDPKSNFCLKSTVNNSAFWINPKVWSFKKGKDDAEYAFQMKGKDLYGMSITEKVEIPSETIAEIALDNAKGMAPNTSITYQEYRTVNGNKVLYQEMEGNMKGFRFTFIGYYYSDSSGTTQFITWTGKNLVPEYRNAIETFLNGFAAQ